MIDNNNENNNIDSKNLQNANTNPLNEEQLNAEEAFNKEFNPSLALFTFDEERFDVDIPQANTNEQSFKASEKNNSYVPFKQSETDYSPEEYILESYSNYDDIVEKAAADVFSSEKAEISKEQAQEFDDLFNKLEEFDYPSNSPVVSEDSVKAATPIKKESKFNSLFSIVKDRANSINMSKQAAAIAAGVVLLVLALITGGVLAATGIIPVFAEDVYGVFVEGKLVAASHSQENLDNSINDFLIYYQTLEAQESLENVRFTNQYEVRKLTNDEIKEYIYKEKKGASTTTEVTEATVAAVQNSAENAQGSSENTDTAASAATTSATTAETASGSATGWQTNEEGKTYHVTTNKENPVNVADGKIVVSDNIEELQTILFYGDKPEIYTVDDKDNVSRIANKFNLTLTELMVPNPDLLEDITIGEGQEVKIVKMAGPLKLSFSREVTSTEEIAFKTIEEKTDELYEGEKKVSQQGKEGIKQEITKYDYENNVIVNRTNISNEVIEEPTNKIIKIGTKKKTNPNQSSGLSDDGGASQTPSSGGYIWPVTGARLSSRFGRRSSPTRGASSYHKGLDLAISSGTPIRAAKSGTVTIAGRSGGYGNLVEISHGGGMSTRYGHCSVIKTSRGAKVNQGDVIALVGSTGVSTGPHLHFEVRVNGTAVNPLNYLK